MSRPLWTSADVIGATGGRGIPAGAGWAASGISIDSRSLEAGDLFVALRGPRHDGHDFVTAAFARGAAAALVAEDAVAKLGDSGGPLIAVGDTLAGLEALARAARARSGARIAAVTGSVGKTGVKEALSEALSRSARTHKSPASYNNQWGVPLSLARLPDDARFAVFELGMNHPGELSPLARLVRPHVALVTAVAPAHMAAFGDLAEVAAAKAEIFDGLEREGTAIVNRDAPHADILCAAAEKRGAGRVVTFGFSPPEDKGTHCTIERACEHAGCSCVAATIGGTPITYKAGAPGRHWILNSVAVLAAVQALGADLGLAGLALAGFEAPRGRGSRREVATGGVGFVLIDESYNANPASMAAAIATLGAAEPGLGGRRIAVLGDMLELGARGVSYHADLAGPLADMHIDLVFTCGPLMRALAVALPPARLAGHAADAESLAPRVAAEIKPGDVVMVKGSLGSRMARVVDALAGLAPDRPLEEAG